MAYDKPHVQVHFEKPFKQYLDQRRFDTGVPTGTWIKMVIRDALNREGVPSEIIKDCK